MTNTTFQGTAAQVFCTVCGSIKQTTTTRYIDDETMQWVTIDPAEGAHMRLLADGSEVEEPHQWQSGSASIWHAFWNNDVVYIGPAMSDDDHVIARNVTIQEAANHAQDYADRNGFPFFNDYTDEQA
jgi:hypothetical protein